MGGGIETDRRIQLRTVLVPRGLDGRGTLFIMAATTNSSSVADHLLSVADSGEGNSVFRSYADNLSKLSFEAASLLLNHCLLAGGTRAESAITGFSLAHTTMDQVRKTMPDGLPTGV